MSLATPSWSAPFSLVWPRRGEQSSSPKRTLSARPNAYAWQADRLGYRQTAAFPPHCSVPFAGYVFCQGEYYGQGGALAVGVHVCRFCDVPISEAQLIYDGNVPVPALDLVPISGPVSGVSNGRLRSPVVGLNEDELARMVRETEDSAGEQLDVKRGSRLLAPPSEFGNCQPDLVAVLAVTGRPERVLDRYAPKSQVTLSARVEGAEVRQTLDGSPTYTLVRNPDLDRPVLLANVCSD